MTDLAGRRALVTGASAGIGLEIARSLLGAGMLVGLHHRRPEAELGGILGELRALPGAGLVPLQADLTRAAQQERLVDRFVDAAGGIDVLVNNAGGLYGYRRFADLDRGDWARTVELNATAPFMLTRAAWPHMCSAGGGRVVNISTAAVNYGGSGSSLHYVAAKAALEAMTRTFAKEGAGQNILVNAIRCGVIDTDIHRKVDGYDPGGWQERLSLIPLGRPGHPGDIAGMVRYLIGEGGAFITGQVIAVSGGE